MPQTMPLLPIALAMPISSPEVNVGSAVWLRSTVSTRTGRWSSTGSSRVPVLTLVHPTRNAASLIDSARVSPQNADELTYGVASAPPAPQPQPNKVDSEKEQSNVALPTIVPALLIARASAPPAGPKRTRPAIGVRA